MRWMVATVVALAVLGAAVAGGSVVSNATQTPAVEPGEQFAGAIGAQHAEVSNTVETAALDRRLATAGTPTERAAVLATETDRVEARLDALETQRERLDEDDAGRLATLVATARGLDERLDHIDAARATLSSSLRERYGLTDERLAALQNRAAALHDAEAESLARAVAGDDVGDDLDTEDGDGDDGDDGDRTDDGTDGTEDGEETTESDSEDGTTEESDGSDGSDGSDSDSSDGDGETTEADASDGDSSDGDGETTEEDSSDGGSSDGDGETDGSDGDSTTTATEDGDSSDGGDGESDGDGDGESDG